MEASRDAVTARVRNDELITHLSSGYRKGQVISVAEALLLKKKQEEEQAKLNADIESSTERFIGLLREGKEKSYSVPIPDGPPIFLYVGRPNYTEEARQKKIEGKVSVRLRLEADGTIDEIGVVSGLGDGLDEQAIESLRQILFLPAIRNGVFVQSRTGAYAEFNLR
jgi:TonB family protein